MGGSQPPFLYQPVKNDDRFPATPFDPKAVTRASYEAKKPKPKPNGPLVSFNRHPEYGTFFRPIPDRTEFNIPVFETEL
jgi:hypothetical protein